MDKYVLLFTISVYISTCLVAGNSVNFEGEYTPNGGLKVKASYTAQDKEYSAGKYQVGATCYSNSNVFNYCTLHGITINVKL